MFLDLGSHCTIEDEDPVLNYLFKYNSHIVKTLIYKL